MSSGFERQENQVADIVETQPETDAELSYEEEEKRHQDKLNELARNSPYFVQCDEEIFPLNDDGSERMHGRDESVSSSKDVSKENEMQYDSESNDTYTYLDNEQEDL